MEKEKKTSAVANVEDKKLSFDISTIDPKLGLNDSQVQESKDVFGPNKLQAKKKEPLFIKILKQFKEPIIILLLVAACISFALAIVELVQHPGNTVEIVTLFVEPAVILGIIATNVIFSLKQEGKTEKALESLKNLSAPMCKVVRNGQTIVIPSENVVVGDILVLEAGDQIAADGTLIEAANLKVEESVLTGESLPVDKDASFVSTDDMPLGDRKNWVFSGTVITNGRALCRVQHIGMNTQVGKIAKLLNDEKPSLTPLQAQIAKLSKWVGIAAVSICIVTFFLYLFAMTGYIGYNWGNAGESLNVSVSLAIAAIPEGLLAVVTVILSISIQSMSKQNALIKRLPAVETLGSTSIICTDKTGTLTQNKMTIVKIWDTNSHDGISEEFKNYKTLLEYGSLCNDTKILVENGKAEFIGDPTETAIVKCFYDQGWNFDQLNAEFPRLAELPFDSDRKMMSVVVKSDKPEYKYMVITKGGPDRVFAVCTHNSESEIEAAKMYNNNMGEQALRVLAVAVKYMNEIPTELTSQTLESEMRLIGLYGIIDPPRPEAKVAVAECKKAGIRTIMITGDHKNTASAIARELGILEPGQEAISGQELEKMSDEEFQANIERYSVYARVSPNDKIRIVKAWKAKGKIVSMTGDGVNDAPSLKAADIGCAMGITGTDVAKNAAAMILMDDNFSTIVKAVKKGRKIMLNIKSALTLLLTANLTNLITILIGLLTFIVSPMNSLQILWINVVAETLLGLAIAKNKRRERVMEFKPRAKDAFIIDKHMVFQIFFFGLIVGGLSLLMFFLGAGAFCNFDYDKMIHPYGPENTIFWEDEVFMGSGGYNLPLFAGSALAFLTAGICLTFNGLCARTTRSIFVESWEDSKYMLYACFGSLALILLVSYIPKVNLVFNMDPYAFSSADGAAHGASGYAWFNALPYIAALFFIGAYELYKVVFHLIFNDDGSKKQGKIVNDKNPKIANKVSQPVA